MGYRIELARNRLSAWQSAPIDLHPGPGEIVARIDLAAITANNVTYAVHGGPPLHYWNFFPAADESHGVVPVWGYATVTESGVDGIAPGDRFFGYWPSATHLKLQPGPLKAGAFSDMAPHRQGLAPVYNAYRPAGDVPADMQPLVALFQPLYGTSFVLAHFLGAAAATQQVILTSASSKTAIGTAWNLKRQGARVIGLTSPGNLDFVRATGAYTDVLAYADVETLDPGAPAILVDFAGNGALKARLHHHLKGLTASHIVGDTHWETSGEADLPGPAPALFFAPSVWEARAREIGPAAFDAELAASMRSFLADATRWLEVVTVEGEQGYAQAFGALLEGKAPARQGVVWKP
jgi:hypothetical protein